MSPSESQLRAALQDGEGEAPDASLLISHALQVRRDRRHRITAIASGVAVVAVLGVGTTALVSSGRGTSDGSSGGSSADSAVGGAAIPAKEPAAHASAAASSAANPRALSAPTPGGQAGSLKCPATPARYMLPGGGGSGQFGSGDPLFPDAVTAIKVCGYPQTAGATPRSHVYAEPTSTQIVTALESAPTTRSSHMCADNTYLRGTIEILAVDAKGRALKPVVITLGCQAGQATNGTAVRYVSAVPDELIVLVH